MAPLRRLIDLLKVTRDAAVRWADDECYRLAPALAYFALFSLFPLMLLCLTGLSFWLGQGDAARHRLLAALPASVSPEARDMLAATLRSLQQHRQARGIGAALGLATLLVGASGAFSELEAALNRIWRATPPRPASFGSAVLRALKAKAVSFAVVAAAQAAILASLVLSAAVAAVAQSAARLSAGSAVLQVSDALASLGFDAVVLGALYRIVPRARVTWRDVRAGAMLTAVLFTALKALAAWAFVHLLPYSAYGAVGGVLSLLTWMYLATLVLYYGAEWSRLYAERFGSLAPQAANATAAGRSPNS